MVDGVYRVDGKAALSRTDLLHTGLAGDPGLLMREVRVLGPGLLEGVRQGGERSMADLRQFEKEFRADPSKAVGNFVQNHWSEAAVGAALTFVCPRKWANIALAAASMRGVITATGETALLAAISSDQEDLLAANYAKAIAHETQAMLNGLPMALAGGAVGKVGANAVFGRNMGAWDLASGKVKWADVKANLYNMKDQVMPAKVKLVVADLDNTLVSTRKYLALGIEDGIAEVSQRTGISQQQLYRVIGEKMEANGAHTYPWTLEMALAEPLGVGKPGGWTLEQFKTNVTDPFWQAMDKSLATNLNLYEGVSATLQALKDRKLPVVVLSNSTTSSGLRRFTAAGLDKGGLIERFYTLPNYKEPVGLAAELLESGRVRMNELTAGGRHPLQRTLPASAEKPSTLGMEHVIRAYKVRPQEVLFIGDNLRKDMGLAEKTGVRGFRAQYSDADKVHGHVLDRLQEGIEKKPKTDAPPPVYEADAAHFAEIMNNLKKPVDYKQTAVNALRSLLVAPDWYLPLQTYNLDRDM